MPMIQNDPSIITFKNCNSNSQLYNLIMLLFLKSLQHYFYFTHFIISYFLFLSFLYIYTSYYLTQHSFTVH